MLGPRAVRMGFDKLKSSGTLWSKLAFAYCQVTQPEDFRSLDGLLYIFQIKLMGCWAQSFSYSLWYLVGSTSDSL